MEKKYKSNLQTLRKRAGFRSAKAFAEYAGVNVKTYTNHEQGDAAMSLLQAWEYADLLECTLDELAGRRVPEQPSISEHDKRILDAYHVGNKYVRRTIDHAVEDAFDDMDEIAKNEEGIA